MGYVIIFVFDCFRTNVSPISETMKQLADQLMQLNATSHITFDTRTPPKFREQTRRDHAEIIEFGHAGIAEPVDDEALLLDEANKKMNFYKIDKPTTDSGLSTWILLSGQSSTNKPTKKTAVQAKNATASNDDKVIKPIFKRKSTTPIPAALSTTKKPTTLVSTTLKANIATTALTTEKPEKTTKLTKVKASFVNNTKTTQSVKKVTNTATTAKPSKTTPKLEASTLSVSTSTKKTDFVKVPTKSSASTELQPEAKEGTLDLSTTTTDKKTKRPTTASPKKKKNKNRRKKPVAEDKMDSSNSTKLSTKNKERPIGTQLYNYLSREVMPTVGVGLVGLMVTAGLASYFLYPFGALRRSYEIDRKDKEGNYHYTDEYSGGIAEEEAIGKVIAGMPVNNYYNTRSHNSRNTYGLNDYNNGMNVGYQPNSRFRNVDQRYMEGSVETVALNPLTKYQAEEVIIGSPKKNTYSNHKDTYETFEKLEPNKDSVSIMNDDEFVVGNVPQEIVQASTEAPTPAVVPEHGPRTIEEQNADHEKVFVVESVPAHAEALYSMEHMPRRRRRQVPRRIDKTEKDVDNEIDTSDKKPSFVPTTTTTSTSTTINPTLLPNSDSTKETLYDTTTTDEFFTTTINPIAEKTETIFGLIKDLIYLKLRLGLQVLHDKAQSLTRYFKNVQERIDVTYRNVNQTIRYS